MNIYNTSQNENKRETVLEVLRKFSQQSKERAG